MKTYLLYIELINAKRRTFCFKGLAMSIESFLKIQESLYMTHNELYYLYANKFNQDPLENLFGMIRARNVNKSNPNASEFSFLLAKVIAMKFMFKSKFSNCEEDDTEYLKLDWSAILENDTTEDILIESERPQNETLVDQHCEEILNKSETESPEDMIISVKFPDVSDLATRYFADYCLLKSLSKMNIVCKNCIQQMSKDKSDIQQTEILIKLKEYENSREETILFWPSEIFYQVCKLHIQIFPIFF